MQSINDVALLCSGSFFNDGLSKRDPGLFMHRMMDSPWHNLETQYEREKIQAEKGILYVRKIL